jgi:DnaK suppressor protein
VREFEVVKKMNKKEREQFRQMLQQKKAGIVRKLSELTNESKEMETNVAQDVVDKAETSYTKEFLLSLSDADREQLLLIDEALKRIDRNEFGICQLCHKEIGRKRLEAIPWTPYCIDCQEKAEEESKAQ